jgi:hypothetical protein
MTEQKWIRSSLRMLSKKLADGICSLLDRPVVER